MIVPFAAVGAEGRLRRRRRRGRRQRRFPSASARRSWRARETCQARARWTRATQDGHRRRRSCSRSSCRERRSGNTSSSGNRFARERFSRKRRRREKNATRKTHGATRTSKPRKTRLALETYAECRASVEDGIDWLLARRVGGSVQGHAGPGHLGSRRRETGAHVHAVDRRRPRTLYTLASVSHHPRSKETNEKEKNPKRVKIRGSSFSPIASGGRRAPTSRGAAGSMSDAPHGDDETPWSCVTPTYIPGKGEALVAHRDLPRSNRPASRALRGGAVRAFSRHAVRRVLAAVRRVRSQVLAVRRGETLRLVRRVVRRARTRTSATRTRGSNGTSGVDARTRRPSVVASRLVQTKTIDRRRVVARRSCRHAG